MKPLYQGSIRELAIGADRVLSLILEQEATGHLMLIAEGGQDSGQELIYLQGGEVVACSSLLQVPVRNLLVSQNLISPKDVAEAEAEAAAEGRADSNPEQILLRSGKVTMQQVLGAVEKAVRESCVKAMTSPAGLFVFKPADNVSPQRQLARLPFREVILQYGRSVARPSELLYLLVREDHILRLSVEIDDIREVLRFNPEETKLLFRVDGRRSLSQIRKAMSGPEGQFERLLFTMLLVGAIYTSEVPSTAPVGILEDSGIHPDDLPRDGNLSPAPEPAVPLPPPGAPKRILIVDDSLTIQEMVQEALRDLDFPNILEVANDGLEAIAAAEKNRPDLVILDVVMPGLDGYKVCTRLRKMLAPVNTPIVMLTGQDGTFSLIKGKLAGASNYITKPFEANDLRRLVADHLRGDGA
jgi:twitching motility two-component system response regulator PilG